jgi:hypothetical protein
LDPLNREQHKISEGTGPSTNFLVLGRGQKRERESRNGERILKKQGRERERAERERAMQRFFKVLLQCSERPLKGHGMAS